MALTNIW